MYRRRVLLVAVAAIVGGCGTQVAPSASTGTGTARPSPTASTVAWDALGRDCAQRDASGRMIFRPPAETEAPIGGVPAQTAVEKRAMALQARYAGPRQDEAMSSICSDGRRVLVASHRITKRSTTPDGDLLVPLREPLARIIDRQGELMERFHASSAGFDVVAQAYVVGVPTTPLPADTTEAGYPVHFEQRVVAAAS